MNYFYSLLDAGRRRLSLGFTPPHGLCPAARPQSLAIAALLFATLALHTLSAQTVLPTGFSETQIPGFSSPSAMVQAPDGRIFVCEQAGLVKVVKDDALLPTPFMSVDAQAYQERGLVGISLDPGFSTNHFVYIYYTAKNPTFHNRLSRFTANGDVVVPGSEVILLDLPTLGESGWHNGGSLHFGPDGKLYLGVGENNIAAHSQSLQTPLGKILRLNADGSIPTDNPFYNSTSGINKSIWALGLRNPFTAAFQPGTGRYFINDVGEALHEEVNDGSRGANYGWPTYQGYSADARFQSPFHAYLHPTNPPASSAITGGTFYNPPTNQFPAAYLGKYFFMDGFLGFIRTLDPTTGEVGQFANNLRPVGVYLITGIDGSLYYNSHAGQSLYKIQYTGILAPQIGSHPANRYVSVDQSATFQVAAYGSAPLSYPWESQPPGSPDFSPIPGANQPAYTHPTATIAQTGTRFRCVVSNSAGTAPSRPATLTVTTDRPPVGTILTPPPGATYIAGDTFSFSGTASDPESGPLFPSAFSWRVDFQHHDHSHPFVTETLGVTNGTFTIPTIGETSDDVWYRIHLTVTDSTGLSHTSFRDILPVKSTVTLLTDPPGLRLALDGETITAPHSFVGVAGVTRTLSVDSQVSGSTVYEFISWSDGGEPTHNITTPATNVTITARLRPATIERDSAAFVSQSFLTLMIAGQRYPVQVTLRNNGSTIWSTNNGYFLGSADPEDNLMWGMNRVTLPAPVAPGEFVTFNFIASAPYPGGPHSMQWRMVREGTGYFGEPTTTVPILVTERGNAAIILDQQVPTSVGSGQRFNVSFTIKNVGTNTWTPDSRHRIGSQNPEDNTLWGLNRVAVTNTVAPGETATLTFLATAPEALGRYNFQWRPLQEGIEFFGETTTNTVIEVLPPLLAASFVSQSVPTQLLPGQRYNATIFMRNTGREAWTPANRVRLGSVNPIDNRIWFTARASATADVPPGAIGRFDFPIFAPTNGGSYNFQWRMIQEGIVRFGETTPNLVLRVAQPHRAAFVSQSIPASLAPGQSAPVQITLRNVGTNTWRTGALFHLADFHLANPGLWGLTNVPLRRTVAPGENAVFTFAITAPTNPGNYNFRWRMQQDGQPHFGEPTPLRSIRVTGTGDHSQFVSQVVPNFAPANSPLTATIRFRNTGTNTWTTAAGYSLGSLNPVGNQNWGANRIPLPRPVPPGATVDFTLNLSSPDVPNTYQFQWQLQRDATGHFGQSTPVRPISILSGGNNAAFIALSVTNLMVTGQTYTASVTLRNTGTNTWTHAANYHLGAENPADDTTWNLLRANLDRPVPPNQNITFTFSVRAPATPGTYPFQWRMLQTSFGRFGDFTPSLPISVVARAPEARADATFLQTDIPAGTTIPAGQPFNVSITVSNRGTLAWSSPNGYRLAAQNPPRNNTWGISQVSVTGNVSGGATTVFSFTATAPITPGSYNFQWQMLHDATGFFGDLGPNTPITVTAAPTNHATFVSQTVPGTLLAGTTNPVSITFRNTGTTTWTPTGNYALASLNPADNTTWGGNRVPNSQTVAPGETVLFNFNIVTPTTPGDYNFQWRLTQSGAGLFGAPSENAVISVTAPPPPVTNHATFVSAHVPALMATGETNLVTIRMRNTGTTTWTPQSGYALASQNPADNTTWGGNRATLDGFVAPGAIADFNFTIIAPTNTGFYNFQWQMNILGSGSFGQTTSNLLIHVSGPPRDDAEFVSQSVTNRMIPGEFYSATVTLRNTGNTTWSPQTFFNLGSQSPEDNTTWGFARIELTNSVHPGQLATFDIPIFAPTNTGTYDFQWRMVHENVDWFGPFTPAVSITVATGVPLVSDATPVSLSAPTTMTAGQTRTVTIVMRNTGNTTWTTTDAFALASQNPAANSTWGTNRIALPAPVPPGESGTFFFPITAPAPAGNYNFQWRMLQGANGYFGSPTTNLTIAVTSPATTNAAQFVSQSPISSVRKGSNFFVTIRFTNTGTSTWTRETGFRLGARNPTDNTTWGFARVELGTSIAPGATATLFFQCRAPATAGAYNMQWQMLQEGVDWFGDRTTNATINVTD